MAIAKDKSQYQFKNRKSSGYASKPNNDYSGEAEDIIDALVRQWKIEQSMEKQQGKKEIQKHVDTFTTASNKIQQQHEEVLKPLVAAKEQIIESRQTTEDY